MVHLYALQRVVPVEVVFTGHHAIPDMKHKYVVQAPIVIEVVGMWGANVRRAMKVYIIMDIITHIITHVTTTIMSRRIMHHHPTMHLTMHQHHIMPRITPRPIMVVGVVDVLYHDCYNSISWRIQR